MRCQLCRNLELAFEARRNEYIQASSFASYQISKKFAAYVNVEMERALVELDEHRSVCISAAQESARPSVAAQLRLAPQDARSSSLGTAA